MLRTLIFSAYLFFHPVHVTLTSIDYTQETGVFKAFVKMYFDDFLRDCYQGGEKKDNVAFSDNDSVSIAVMQKYLAQKIKLEVNEKLLEGNIRGMTFAGNEISINIEYGRVKRPKRVSVTNLIMTSLYLDQSNMLIVRVNDFEEGVKLTPESTEKTFSLK